MDLNCSIKRIREYLFFSSNYADFFDIIGFLLVIVAQPGRAPVCGTGCRGFKSRRSPKFFR